MKRTIINLLAAAALCVPLAGKEPEEFLLGAGFHFGSHTGDIEANLDIASRIGLNAGRDERLWNAVEWNKGEYIYGNFVEKAYTQAARRGLAMIFILAYGNRHYDNGNYPVRPETAEAFCRFAEHTARHFGDRAEFFQVWNEWEGSTSMPAQFKDTGTSEAYVKFLKQVAPRIRAAAPQARIVANSISSGDRCLDYYLKNGVLEYVDYLAMHTYNFADGPGRDTVDAFAARLEKIRTMIRAANGGRDFPVFITEMGIPTSTAPRVGRTEHQQAAQLAQILLVCRMFDFLRGFWWYDFQDDNIKPEFTESNYGLIRPDTTLKESAYVVADLSRLIRRGKFVRRLPVADRKLWLLQYELDGKDVLAAFHTYPEDDFKIVLENASETLPPVSVRHAGRAPLPRNWGYRDWLRKGQPEWGNRLSITVRDMPVLLEGDLSRVTVAEVEKRDFPRFAAAPPPLPEPEFSVAALPVGTSGGMTPVNGYRPLNNSGPRCPEFAAEFMVRYDARNLYLTAVVTDRSFFCDQPVEDAWTCDSIQVAVQSRAAGSDPGSWLEADAARTAKGAELYLRRFAIPETEALKPPVPEITVQEGKTVYKLTFPAEFLGMTGFARGDRLGLAFLVNDNDGSGRRGYLHWADGIGVSKDPARFGLVELK